MPNPASASQLPRLFAAAMRDLLPGKRPRKLAVAVSGGSDSMALTLLAAKWAEKHDVSLTALTVDHGLRPASAGEARQVKQWLAARGIKTTILKWEGPHPNTGIQQAARDARYELMSEYCEKKGISILLLGHQLEDQLETMLMRLSKGSGLEGLAAMQGVSMRGNLTLLRPLLGQQREALRDYLRKKKQDWIDDPSNENPVFTRTRVGSVLFEMQQLPGSDIESIALSLARLQRANESLDALARQVIEESCEISPLGYIRLPIGVLEMLPEELALRVLMASLRAVGGGQRIKLQALELLYQRLFLKKDGKSGTLGGAQIVKSGQDWLLCREPGRAGLPETEINSPQTEWLWDERFIVKDLTPREPLQAPLHLRALGSEGWAQVKDKGSQYDIPHLPAKVRNSLPALWSGKELVAAPLIFTDKEADFGLNQRFEMRFRAFYWMPALIS